MAKRWLSLLAILVSDRGAMMAKSIYLRKNLEHEFGELGAQNFLNAQANRGINEPYRVKRVVRVFNGEGKRRVLEQVVIVS